MNTIIFKVTGNRLTRVGGYDPVSGEKKYTEFRFEFDSEWNGVRSITVTMFFDVREPQNIVVDVENGVALCNIEEELRNKSGILWVGVSGYDTVSGATLDCYLTALPVGEGTKVTEVATTRLYQQIVELVGRIETKLPVSTVYIKDLAVTTAKLAEGAVTGDKVKKNTLTPDKFDRAYWEKKVFTQVIDSYSGLFSSILPINSGGSICIANLNIITGAGRLSGYCEIVAVLEDTGTGMYITNLGDGSCWKIFKEKDKEVFSAFHNKDIRYLTKSYTNLGEVIEDFDTLFQKVGYISMGGTVGFVKILVSGSDKVTINSKEGYLSGEFLVVGSPTYTKKTVYLRNLFNGECWTVVHKNDGSYLATKIDGLTPRVERLEKYSVINLGAIANKESLKNVSFNEDNLYRFSFTGEMREIFEFQDNDCLGSYGFENGPGGYLKFINLENGKSGVYWIDLGSYVENSGSGGADGEDGTSVTILSISESAEDSGSNIVTFSSGETLTIKNGAKGTKGDKGDTGVQGPQGDKGEKGEKGDKGDRGEQGLQGLQGEKGDKGDKGDTGVNGKDGATGEKGADGYTPIKGVDYFTEEDKAEIVKEVIESLGGSPVFGYVDENNNIVVSGNLAEGSYSVKYEMEDGSTVDIGSLVLSNEESEEPETPDTPVITNLLPLSVDTDGSDYAGTHANGGDGFEYGYRISRSSGSQSASDNMYCTGFMPVTLNDIIRIKNISISSANESWNNIVYYDSNKTYIAGSTISTANAGFALTDGIWSINPNQATANTSIAFFRFSCGSITDETIVTVNQEIA